MTAVIVGWTYVVSAWLGFIALSGVVLFVALFIIGTVGSYVGDARERVRIKSIEACWKDN